MGARHKGALLEQRAWLYRQRWLRLGRWRPERGMDTGGTTGMAAMGRAHRRSRGIRADQQPATKRGHDPGHVLMRGVNVSPAARLTEGPLGTMSYLSSSATSTTASATRVFDIPAGRVATRRRRA